MQSVSRFSTHSVTNVPRGNGMEKETEKRTKNSSRYAYVLLAFMQAGLTSGITFGWPSLQKIFEDEGIYVSHCAPNATIPCDQQKEFYQHIYTLATFLNNIAPLITGVILDWAGPKKTNILSAAVFFVGCGLFAVPGDYPKMPAFGLLGLAGPGIYCSIMHLSNLFPGHQSSVLSFFSGTFAASSFIFKVFELLHNKDKKWLDLSSLFLQFMVLLAPFFIAGAFIWPNRPFEPPRNRPPQSAEATPLLSPTERIFKIKQPLYNAHYMKQFKSLRYWVPVFWLALKNLLINTYIASVSIRYDDGLATWFSLIWSMGWVAIPFYGYMLDKKGLLVSLFVTSLGLFNFALSVLISVRAVHYISFVLVSVVNTGMWGLFYSYLSLSFGFDNYGKLLGISSITVAAVGLLQDPLVQLAVQRLHGNFFWIDCGMTFVSAVVFVCPIYLWILERRVAKKVKYVEHYPVNAVNEAENDTMPLLNPGDDEKRGLLDGV